MHKSIIIRRLDEMFRQSLCEPGPSREGIHVTDLVGCIRQTYYNKTLKWPPNIQSLLRMRIGTEVHHIKSFPSEKYDDDGVFHEKTMEWEGITGTMDEFYRGIIVDKKTTRSLPMTPKDSHVQQVMYYKVLAEEGLGLPVTDGAICYIDVNNAVFRHLHVPLPTNTDRIQAEMITRRDTLLSALELGRPPEREPQWCDTCPYGAICYRGG